MKTIRMTSNETEIDGAAYGLADLRFEHKGLVHLVRMSENQPEVYVRWHSIEPGLSMGILQVTGSQTFPSPPDEYFPFDTGELGARAPAFHKMYTYLEKEAVSTAENGWSVDRLGAPGRGRCICATSSGALSRKPVQGIDTA